MDELLTILDEAERELPDVWNTEQVGTTQIRIAMWRRILEARNRVRSG